MQKESVSADGKFLDPVKIINQIDIAQDSVIADFGCASGYFALPFAQRVSKEGKLFALDILPHILETVKSRAIALGLSNVTTKRVNLEKENGSEMDSESLDWVIMKGVLFQNKDKSAIIKEAYRVLKSGGKILVVEWGDSDFSIGPHKNLRIPVDILKELVEKEKFRIEKDIDAGSFHYAFVAVK
ncbi:MAG: hypothetical protein ACD_11C00054G0002 [uncultured bacterium]|nr:MAG: hypothetical protein ACD_11C00054G0002 [uncultured bacterium]HBR71992.1 hypothetical protein [Candidatus Moranbacteria bacterium]